MFTQLAWWDLCFLLYGVLLDHVAALWWSQNPPVKLSCSRAKAKIDKKRPSPRTPLDCLHCQAQAKTLELPTQVTAEPILAYNQTKSNRGHPKKIPTQGYACPNPKCLYYGCTHSAFHALVGDGCHGKATRIQTFKCQQCKTTFSQRKNTPLYYLKTPSSKMLRF